MSDEPCPRCGPLQAEVERLMLEVEALQREDEAQARLLGIQHQRIQELLRHLRGDVDYWEHLGALASKELERIRELEQALADERRLFNRSGEPLGHRIEDWMFAACDDEDEDPPEGGKAK